MVTAMVEWQPRWCGGHGGKEVEVVRRTRWSLIVDWLASRLWIVVMMVDYEDDGSGCDNGDGGGGFGYGRRSGDGVVYSIGWWLSYW
ncbi:hypothetical protein Tco_1482773 [Tanacetum coccineum]